MLQRGRLIPLINGARLWGWITFYICNTGDENKYLRRDMWSVEKENPNGNCCYIDHFITNKNPENSRLSLQSWREFKGYIRRVFPNVKIISWKRYHNEQVKVRAYNLKGKNA